MVVGTFAGVLVIDPVKHNSGLIPANAAVGNAVNVSGAHPIVSTAPDKEGKFTVQRLGADPWTFAVHSGASAPVVSGPAVYVSMDNFVFALNQQTGQPIMKTDVGSVIPSPTGPAVDPLTERFVVVATLPGQVIKFDPETGVKRWELVVGGARFNDGVSIDINGNIFVRSFEGRLYVIGPNGNLMPDFFDSGTSDPLQNFKGALFGPAVAVHGGQTVAYVADAKHKKLTAVSVQGTVLWERDLPGVPLGHPVVAGDIVYLTVAVAPNVKLMAFKRNAVQWSIDVEGETCLAVGNGNYIYGVSGKSVVHIIQLGG